MKLLVLATALGLPFAPILHAQTFAPAASRAPAAAAPDLVTRSGKVYKAARLSSVEPDGVTYFYAGGVVKIPFDDLPDAVRQQYGYDKEKAAKFAAAEASAQAQYAASVAAAQQRAAVRAQHDQAMTDFKATGTKVIVKIEQITRDGVIGEVYAVEDVKSLEYVPDPIGLEPDRKRPVLASHTEVNKMEKGSVMIRGIGEGLADGDEWTGMVWLGGIYKDGYRTMRQYFGDPEAAAAAYLKQVR